MKSFFLLYTSSFLFLQIFGYFREVSLQKSLITMFLKMKWQPYNKEPFSNFQSISGLVIFPDVMLTIITFTYRQCPSEQSQPQTSQH